MTIKVKYLPEEAIEHDAEVLLAEYAHARGVAVTPPIPIEDIVEKHLKLRIDFDDLHRVLGVPQTGPEPDIFGAIWVDKREIYIDQSLDPEEHPGMEGRFRFTLTHVRLRSLASAPTLPCFRSGAGLVVRRLGGPVGHLPIEPS